MPRLRPEFEHTQLIPRYVDRVVIPTNKVKTLFSVPIQITPQVPGIIVVPIAIWFNKTSGIAYNLNGNSLIDVNSNGSILGRVTFFSPTITGLLDANGETYLWYRYYALQAARSTGQDLSNSYLELKLRTADMSVGEGDLAVTFTYDCIPTKLAWL